MMSLMNGVDSEEIIGEVIDPSKIVHSLIKVASERKGNQVVFDPETTIGIIYGEADLSRGTGRIEALNDLFADTGAALPCNRRHPHGDLEQIPAQRAEQPGTGDGGMRGRRLP